MTSVRYLERRIQRLENTLIELALYKRCKYIYSSELKKELLRNRILKEKNTIIKADIGQGGRPEKEKNQENKILF